MDRHYEWMLVPTAQEGWVTGKGVMVWLSLAFGLAGAGAYLVSLFFGDMLALLISWAVVTVLKNLAHLLHAGHPLRMWRMVRRPGRSWLARGTIVTALFSVVGFLQLLTMWLAPGTAAETVLKVFAGILAAGIVLYEGFTISGVKAIPFWHSLLVPVLFALWAAAMGFGFVLAVNNDGPDTTTVTRVSLILVAAILVALWFYLWLATRAGEAGASSVDEVVRASLAPFFWGGVILIGAVVPGAILAYSFAAGEAVGLGAAVALYACEVIGGMSMVYCILRAGRYRPITDGR